MQICGEDIEARDGALVTNAVKQVDRGGDG